MNRPPRGLALTGSILAIVSASLMLIGGVFVLAATRHSEIMTIGLIAIVLALPGIILGAIGCTIRPGPILANAIVFTLKSLLMIAGLTMNRVHPAALFVTLLYVSTTVFLYLGFAQALRYRRALQA